MTIKIKINNEFFYHPVKKHIKKDTILEIEVDSEGTPLDSFWRNVLNDAKTDFSISIEKTKK